MILTRQARLALMQVLLAAAAGVAAFQCWSLFRAIGQLEDAANTEALVNELRERDSRAKGSK